MAGWQQTQEVTSLAESSGRRWAIQSPRTAVIAAGHLVRVASEEWPVRRRERESVAVS
jgi:hypothetical protein